MSRFGRSLALFLIAALLPSVAQASCRTGGKIAADLWKKWGDEAILIGCAAAAVEGVPFGTCMKTAAFYQKIAQATVKFWNVAAANSWATIGPRRIEFGESQSGTLVSTAGRMFMSALPLEVDKVTVRIEKQDGRAGAKITLCSFPAEGAPQTLVEIDFDKGNDDGKILVREVGGLKGRILGVHMDAKSVVRKFEYALTVTKAAK